MSKDEKTEHLPSHKATLIRPVPKPAPATTPDAPAQDAEQTVLRAPTELTPAPVDPDATVRTTREQVADTAARTLQAASPTSQSAYAQTLQSPGPAV